MTLRSAALTLLAGNEGKAMIEWAPPSVPEQAVPGSVITPKNADLYMQTYGGSEAIDHVMAAAGLFAETASQAAIHFERNGEFLTQTSKPTPFDPPDARPAPQDLVTLLSKPNPWQFYDEMTYLLTLDYLLAGNALVAMIGDPDAPTNLWRMAPPFVEVVPGDMRKGEPMIAGYNYRIPGAPEPVFFPADRVIHMKRPNPHSDFWGLSVVAGAPGVFDTELAMTESLRGYFRRGTKLSGVLTSERRVADQVFKRVKREWRTLYAGDQAAYQVAILEAGLKFQSIQATAADAEYKNLGGWSRDRIYALFGEGLVALKYPHEFQPATVQQAQRLFDTKTMRPFLNRWQTRWTEELTKKWGVEFKIDYEFTQSDEERYKNAGQLATLQVAKVKEIRDAAGLPPLGDDRDDLVIGLDTVLSGTADGGPATHNLAGEGGRPPGLGQPGGGDAHALSSNLKAILAGPDAIDKLLEAHHGRA